MSTKRKIEDEETEATKKAKPTYDDEEEEEDEVEDEDEGEEGEEDEDEDGVGGVGDGEDDGEEEEDLEGNFLWPGSARRACPKHNWKGLFFCTSFLLTLDKIIKTNFLCSILKKGA